MKSVLFLIFFLAAQSILACSCSGILNGLDDLFERSKHVAKVRVLNVETDSANMYVYINLQIIESWKGPDTESIHVQSNTSSAACGIVPNIGDTLISFIFETRNGETMWIDNCTTVSSFPELEHALDYHTGKILSSSESIALKIYPNPVKDYLNVNLDYQEMHIYDLQGRLQFRDTRGTKHLNISRMRPGTYLMLVRLQDQSILFREKLVKE